MTSPTLAQFNKRRGGFTLTEILVVIGIIVLLAGLLVPMVMKAYRAGDRTRTAADLQAIAVGLEAYKQDFGSYPVVPIAKTGFAVLGRVLVAPGYVSHTYDSAGVAPTPANKTHLTPWDIGDIQVDSGTEYVCVQATSNPPPTIEWAVFGTKDGAGSDNQDASGSKPDSSDMGFRTRISGVIGQGRIYGPYLAVDKFKMRGMAILDRNGQPFLYYPANKSPVSTIYDATTGTKDYYVNLAGTALYNGDDNSTLLPQAQLRAMLGDRNMNGVIEPGETAASIGSYLLWAAGPDTTFGPQFANIPLPSAPDPNTLYTSGSGYTEHNARVVSRCDDVTNFR